MFRYRASRFYFAISDSSFTIRVGSTWFSRSINNHRLCSPDNAIRVCTTSRDHRRCRSTSDGSPLICETWKIFPIFVLVQMAFETLAENTARLPAATIAIYNNGSTTTTTYGGYQLRLRNPSESGKGREMMARKRRHHEREIVPEDEEHSSFFAKVSK
jgi:hypothetical protein